MPEDYSKPNFTTHVSITPAQLERITEWLRGQKGAIRQFAVDAFAQQTVDAAIEALPDKVAV
jgi:hypothetical protein